MRKRYLYALTSICWFAGCSSPASDEIEMAQNLFPVQFSVELQKEELPFSPTRSMPPNTIPEPTVPDKDSSEKEFSDLCSAIEYLVYKDGDQPQLVKHKTYRADTEPDFGIVYDTLPAGNYQVCFLAYSCSENAVFSGNILSFNKVPDSFYHSKEFIVGKSETTNEDISLKRIVGRIEFCASDPVPEELKTFEIFASNYPGRFNIQTGKGVISTTPYSSTHTFTEEEKQQSDTSHSFLSFIPEGETKISVRLTSKDTNNTVMREYTDIAILPILNRTIRYTGILYTPPKPDETDNTFNLIIENNGEWDAPEENELLE